MSTSEAFPNSNAEPVLPFAEQPVAESVPVEAVATEVGSVALEAVESPEEAVAADVGETIAGFVVDAPPLDKEDWQLTNQGWTRDTELGTEVWITGQDGGYAVVS